VVGVDEVVGGVALAEHSSQRSDRSGEVRRSQRSAVGRTCCPADVLVNERSAEVVDTGVQQLGDTLQPDLWPRRLNVVDMAVVRNASNRVHEQGLSIGRPPARSTAQVDGRGQQQLIRRVKGALAVGQQSVALAALG